MIKTQPYTVSRRGVILLREAASWQNVASDAITPPSHQPGSSEMAASHASLDRCTPSWNPRRNRRRKQRPQETNDTNKSILHGRTGGLFCLARLVDFPSALSDAVVWREVPMELCGVAR